MSKVLVIAGMHRSGTSLITQWLNRCGLYVGNKLAGPEIGNTEGLFEDVEFQRLHKQFLKKRNCSPIGFITTHLTPLDASERKQLEDVIEARNHEHNEWGWKDPITCLFLNEYRELIPRAFYLVIIRDYHATVSSLVTREHKVDMKRFSSKKGLSRLKWKLLKGMMIKRPFELYAEKFLGVWIHYYEEIFAHVRSLPPDQCIFVNYRQLIENENFLFDHLVNDWNFSLHYFPFSTVYKKEMISDVEPYEKYIHNKSLLKRAKEIEGKFNSILFQSQK